MGLLNKTTQTPCCLLDCKTHVHLLRYVQYLCSTATSCNYLSPPYRSSTSDVRSASDNQLHLNTISDSELATVDQRGTVRILETGHPSLER